MNRRPSVAKPTGAKGIQSLKSQTINAVYPKSGIFKSKPDLSAQEQVLALELSRLKIIHDNPIPENYQPIQKNFLTGKIDWKRVFFASDPQYSMNDHA